MGLFSTLGKLLTFPVSGPICALVFLSKQIQKQVDEEAFSPKNVEHELLALQMLHEMGDISDKEFQKKETELLDKLDELMLAKGVLQDVEDEEEQGEERKQEEEKQEEQGEERKQEEEKQEEQVEIPIPKAK